MSASAVLCHVSELTEGAAKGCDPYRVGHDTVIVILRRGQVYVYRDACPHLDTPMAWRKDAYLNTARDRIVCFAHGALFEIESGRCVLGPCINQFLQPVPFNLDAQGYLTIDYVSAALCSRSGQ